MVKKIIGLLIFSLAVSVNNPTYSWFTSEASTKGNITNATTSSLINVGELEVEYMEEMIQVKIPVTNIATLSIPITVNGEERILYPAETYTFIVEKEVTENEIVIHLIGFEKYIDEQYIIPVDPTKVITSSSAITLK